MGFWSRWFGKPRGGGAASADSPVSFDAALRAAVPRYTCMERDGTALAPLLRDPATGVVQPASERFLDRCREWAAIRSPWDRRGVLFSALDDLHPLEPIGFDIAEELRRLA
jgi:hypothetical protein